MGGGIPVPEVLASDLTLVRFLTEFLQRGKPVLIRGHLEAEAWGALEYFSDLSRVHTEHGHRLIPVNHGSPLVKFRGTTYMSLAQLIDEHLIPSNSSHDIVKPSGAPDEEVRCTVAYMSQHHLLHQAPELQKLLAVPHYTLGRALSPVNLWIGTRGTVTSLHSDPSDNLLCQIAGHKYIRLYNLEQTPHLYATMMCKSNATAFGTSPVRVEAPDDVEYPEFSKTTYEETLLGPGDMLFIPKSHWHYVRGLTTSVSANYWF